MDRESLARVAHDWISLWCAPSDWALFGVFHSEDFVDHSSAGPQQSTAAFRRGLEDLIDAFPDLYAWVDDLVMDEAVGRVAVRWSATGTNRSRFLGRGPTHRVAHMTGIEIIEVRDGRISARWGDWDIDDSLNPPS